MVSIEVVRGAAASASFLPSGFRKRSSSPRPQKTHDLTGAIALSSHRPPPSFVPNSAVLVQVHAVGLGGLDKQILTDKLAVSDAGGKGATCFVPGRGVLGRVVECGLEVSSETLKKGEWVIGLLDAKKVRSHRVCPSDVLLY
jgi:NADPH:quinone reductase-like Zn-dependent oxidoreductase